MEFTNNPKKADDILFTSLPGDCSPIPAITPSTTPYRAPLSISEASLSAMEASYRNVYALSSHEVFSPSHCSIMRLFSKWRHGPVCDLPIIFLRAEFKADLWAL